MRRGEEERSRQLTQNLATLTWQVGNNYIDFAIGPIIFHNGMPPAAIIIIMMIAIGKLEPRLDVK